MQKNAMNVRVPCLLALLVACGSKQDVADTGQGLGSETGSETGSAVDTQADTGPAPLASIWPESPYPDSPMRVLVDGKAAESGCVWRVDSVEVTGACDVLGETLGLQQGQTVEVRVNGGAFSAPVQVRALPDLLVTETMASPGRISRIDGDEGVVSAQLEISGAMPFTMPIAVEVWEDEAYFTAHLGYLNGQGIHRVGWDPIEELGSADAAGTVYWAAVDHARATMWVADTGRTSLTPYALPELTMGTPISLPTAPVSVRIQGDTAWVACQPDGSPTGGSAAPGDGKKGGVGGAVVRVDLRAETAVSGEVGQAPYWAEPSPDGSRVAVVDESTDTLILLDAESFEVLQTHAVGEAPTGVAWSPGGETIYVAMYTGGEVWALDSETGETLRTWTLSSGKTERAGVVGVFPRDDGRRLFVPVLHENRLAILDTATDAAPEVISGLEGPRGVALWHAQ